VRPAGLRRVSSSVLPAYQTHARAAISSIASLTHFICRQFPQATREIEMSIIPFPQNGQLFRYHRS